MSVVQEKPRLEGGQTGPYRVLVVDDSAVVRTMLSHWLDADPDITVVGAASDGIMAVDAAARLNPEVILLDIEMPRQSGLTALPDILRAVPDAKVIMVSTLTKAGAEISLQALSAGAADYIAKPQTGRADAAEGFRRDIFAKVKALGRSLRRTKDKASPPSELKKPVPPKEEILNDPEAAAAAGLAFSLRRPTGIAPKIMLIGASTGGPQALMSLLSAWDMPPKLPVIITQHMPAAFTTIMAQRLDSLGPTPCKEAEDEDVLRPGTVYLARGGYHAVVEKRHGAPVLRLDEGSPENFCKPAVDPMFRSAATVYGSGALGVVLTGMGHDGLAGARAIIDSGGTIVAQDQATSVVWGMPGAVAHAGLCTQVVPLKEMASVLQGLLSGVAS